MMSGVLFVVGIVLFVVGWLLVIDHILNERGGA